MRSIRTLSVEQPGSNNFLGEGEKTLLPFIIAHCGCDIKIINEDQLEEYDYDLPFQEWKASRIIQEIERVSQDGRWK